MTSQEQDTVRHLLVVQDGQGKRAVPLESGSYSIGRDVKSSIPLVARSISRQHALLLRVTSPETDEYGFRIVDGNLNGKRSTNGILINGQRCYSHDLRHGDLIEFGDPSVRADYYALTQFTDTEFRRICEAADPHQLLKGLTSEHATVASPIEEESKETAMVRLASFPEWIPHPLIEIDITGSGSVTYSNPAAKNCFANLRQMGTQHPILAGLAEFVQSEDANVLYRVVECEGAFYEQSVHYISESELIRLYITDVTKRVEAERELQRRDRLMQAVAIASNSLLTEMNYEAAIQKALETLGQAASVDRVCIYENHPHPNSGELAMSLRYEWSQEGIDALLPSSSSQAQSYGLFGLTRWHEILGQGQSVKGTVSSLQVSEQAYLRRDHVQSALIMPVLSGRSVWGHISFHDCQTERDWCPQEESTLAAMANSLSGAFQRKQAEEDNWHRARHDSLTKLPNRFYFDDRLADALHDARQHDQDVAVMFLDLDRFKNINDKYGHNAGDALLKQVVERLKSILSPNCTLARWGGDEFTLLMPKVDQIDVAEAEAHRILRVMDPPFEVRNHELYVSASIGIASFRRAGLIADAETLVRHADVALYKAKAGGRNAYAVYNPDSDKTRLMDPELERDLRHALELDQFRVVYQPQMNVLKGTLDGVEALLRWHHPQMGLISPGVFIPIAEERGWIVDIGEWVLRTACAQSRAWQDAGLPALTVAVNLSAKQFREPRLVETVAHILAETKLDARYLELEITESLAIEDMQFTTEILQQMSQLGIRLAIDDFGTGHSSLNRLQSLPLNSLKIDRSFVNDLTRNAKTSHIVFAIVALGKSLGLSLVAEGVETPEQLKFLRDIKCEIAQGYYFHKPLPPEEVSTLLQQQDIPATA